MKQIVSVLNALSSAPHVKFCQVNDRFSSPRKGWADCAVYLFFDSPGLDTLVCEVQIVHDALMLIREDLGAHNSYVETRFYAELLGARGGANTRRLSIAVPWSMPIPAAEDEEHGHLPGSADPLAR